MLSLVLFVGCASNSSPVIADSSSTFGVSGNKSMIQLIIKWRDPGFDPSRPEYLMQLERETGVVFQYVRPMSGGAHVLRAVEVTGDSQRQRLLDGLGKRPEVEYAEVDRRMHHMGISK